MPIFASPNAPLSRIPPRGRPECERGTSFLHCQTLPCLGFRSSGVQNASAVLFFALHTAPLARILLFVRPECEHGADFGNAKWIPGQDFAQNVSTVLIRATPNASHRRFRLSDVQNAREVFIYATPKSTTICDFALPLTSCFKTPHYCAEKAKYNAGPLHVLYSRLQTARSPRVIACVN